MLGGFDYIGVGVYYQDAVTYAVTHFCEVVAYDDFYVRLNNT